MNSGESPELCAWRLRRLFQITQQRGLLGEHLCFRLLSQSSFALRSRVQRPGRGWGGCTLGGGGCRAHRKQGSSLRGRVKPLSDPSSRNAPSPQGVLPDFLIKRRCCLEGAGTTGRRGCVISSLWRRNFYSNSVLSPPRASSSTA